MQRGRKGGRVRQRACANPPNLVRPAQCPPPSLLPPHDANPAQYSIRQSIWLNVFRSSAARKACHRRGTLCLRRWEVRGRHGGMTSGREVTVSPHQCHLICVGANERWLTRCNCQQLPTKMAACDCESAYTVRKWKQHAVETMLVASPRRTLALRRRPRCLPPHTPWLKSRIFGRS